MSEHHPDRERALSLSVVRASENSKIRRFRPQFQRVTTPPNLWLVSLDTHYVRACNDRFSGTTVFEKKNGLCLLHVKFEKLRCQNCSQFFFKTNSYFLNVPKKFLKYSGFIYNFQSLPKDSQ